MKDITLQKALKVGLVVGGVCALAPMVSAQGIGESELHKMLVPTPQKVDRGEKLFAQNCASCHGADGRGKSGVKLANAPGRTFQTSDFSAGGSKDSLGLIQMYDAITYGLDDAVAGGARKTAKQTGPSEGAPEFPPHPTYKYLQYQSRWDIVHYIRNLAEDDNLPDDPPAIVQKARQRARSGVCNPDVKASVVDKVTPKGKQQLEKGKQLFSARCTTCHGKQGKGNGPAGTALSPHPRNFVGASRDDYVNSPSAMGIFTTLTNGIEGSAMASYKTLSQDKRLALAQYVLSIIPDDVEIKSGQQQILKTCRALSTPPKPAPISIEAAKRALVDDQVEERRIHLSDFDPVRLSPNADPKPGKQVYGQFCRSCHGVAGSGRQMGPYGAQPPYLYLKTGRLIPAMAGGSAETFARRSYAGVHATLPNMTSAALLSKSAWRDLQAYVASFDGQGRVTVAAPPTDAAADLPTTQPSGGSKGSSAGGGDADPGAAGPGEPGSSRPPSGDEPGQPSAGSR